MPPTKADKKFGTPNMGVKVKIQSMRNAFDPEYKIVTYAVYGHTIPDVAEVVEKALSEAFEAQPDEDEVDEPVRGHATISPRRPKARRARS